MAFDRIWWVQNVLPLTFDNSLSYYEVLAKVTWYLNGLSDDVSNVIKTLGTIEGIQDVEAYTQFLESIQNSIGSLQSLDTDEKDDIVSAINEVLGVAKKAYVKPKDGIPESDLDSDLQIKINNHSVSSYNQLSDKPSINGVTLVGNNSGENLGLGTYTKPIGGIPETDLSTEVQEKLNQSGGPAGTTNYNSLSNKPSINGVTLSGNKTPAELGLGTYSIPDGGIPMDALSTEVQEAIAAGGGGGTSNYNALINKPSINGHTLIGNVTLEDLGGNYYVKPASGIPENDLSDVVKEKLNASSGIAESIDSFVADKNYEAGDLIYINGVLYKFTTNVLEGTVLQEGENIEKTDINKELEDVNKKIDDINYDISGLTPFDSFRIANEVKYYAGDWTRVFTDVSMLGTNDPDYAGNYLFTVKNKPGTTDWVEYMRLRILKHDGTLVETINVPEGTTGEYRFTFNPPETGLYIVDIQSKVSYTGTDPIADVTLEYTTSQGITAIMTKLNALDGVPERMDAIEDLVSQQQEIVEGIQEDYGDKLTIVDGAYSGGAWGTSFYSLAIKVNTNDKVKLTTGSRTSTYGGLKSFEPNVGDAPDFSEATGWTSFHNIEVNTTVELTIPSDVEYLYLYAGANRTYDRLPIEIIINDVDLQSTAFSQLHSIVENYGSKINEIEAKLDTYDYALLPQKLTPYGIEPQHLSLFKYTPNLFSDFCYHIVDSYYSSTVAPPGAIRVANAPGWQGWLIALKPNTTYTCGPLDFRIYFFDKNYIYTERIQNVNNADNNTFTTGENSVWVAITQRTNHDMSEWMLVEGDTYPEEYISGYPQWVLEPSSVAVDKTIAFMGDSITAGVGATKTYHEYLHDKYHFTCLNYGFGGAGFYKNSTSTSSGRIGMGVPGRGEETNPDNFFTPNNVVARLQELDSSKTDGIVIFAGTNDYGNDVPMEDYESAIEDAFTYCYNNFPLAPILVLTPVHRRGGSEPNATGHNLRDYVDALIEKCKKFGVAYIDTMTMSGLYPDNDTNRSNYFYPPNSGGLHPDYRGHKRIASVVGSMLKDMIDYTSFK